MSHILYIIRDIRQLAGRSSRASGTRWVRPPWEPDGRYIPHRPCVCPRSPCHRLYKSGIPDWRLQKQQRFVKLYLCAVRAAVFRFQPSAKSDRSALDHTAVRVIILIAVQVCRIQKIEHFPDFIFRHVVKPQKASGKDGHSREWKSWYLP